MKSTEIPVSKLPEAAEASESRSATLPRRKQKRKSVVSVGAAKSQKIQKPQESAWPIGQLVQSVKWGFGRVTDPSNDGETSDSDLRVYVKFDLYHVKIFYPPYGDLTRLSKRPKQILYKKLPTRKATGLQKYKCKSCNRVTFLDAIINAPLPTKIECVCGRSQRPVTVQLPPPATGVVTFENYVRHTPGLAEPCHFGNYRAEGLHDAADMDDREHSNRHIEARDVPWKFDEPARSIFADATHIDGKKIKSFDWSCDVCGEEYETRAQYRKHLRVIHKWTREEISDHLPVSRSTPIGIIQKITPEQWAEWRSKLKFVNKKAKKKRARSKTEVEAIVAPQTTFEEWMNSPLSLILADDKEREQFLRHHLLLESYGDLATEFGEQKVSVQKRVERALAKIIKHFQKTQAAGNTEDPLYKSLLALYAGQSLTDESQAHVEVEMLNERPRIEDKSFEDVFADLFQDAEEDGGDLDFGYQVIDPLGVGKAGAQDPESDE
jgi:hypothetical protein